MYTKSNGGKIIMSLKQKVVWSGVISVKTHHSKEKGGNVWKKPQCPHNMKLSWRGCAEDNCILFPK